MEQKLAGNADRRKPSAYLLINNLYIYLERFNKNK